jgi:hypothetical protein
MTDGLRVVLGGVAVVCCPHDREKRQIRTEAAVTELGALAGERFDRRRHRIHLCSCCENLFVDSADIPRYCHACRRPLVHALGGDLPEPIGVV